MINLKKTSIFEDVDFAIPIEIDDNGKKFIKQLVIRDVNSKSLTQVDLEIQNSKQNHSDKKSYIESNSLIKLIDFLPRAIVNFIYKMTLKNHKNVQELSGTVFVTSVSMFSNVPGYIIPYSGGPKALSFAIGSSSRKPVVIKNEIVIREMINLTSIFNHDIVDGATAARFINQLRQYIEKDFEAII